MAGKTISITIPDQLEFDLQLEADKTGISRSRFICNILLDWQKQFNDVSPKGTCINNAKGMCIKYDVPCDLVKEKQCAGYRTE